MAIRDANGDLHDTKNGQYISKTNAQIVSKVVKYKKAREKYGYNKKQYNNYGWARGNEIINAGQNKDFSGKFALATKGRANFEKTQNGEFMIPVSDIYDQNQEGLNNTVVYAKGTVSKPIITCIVKINVNNETDADVERRYLYDCEWRGFQPTTSNIFRFYHQTDYEIKNGQRNK